MPDVSTMAVKLSASAGGFSSGLAGAAADTDAFAGKLSGLGSLCPQIGAALAGVGTAASLAFASMKAIEAFNVQEAAEAKLAAVLKATGNAAGYTSSELKKLAGDLQNTTTYGDETTISAMAVLATFTSIRGDQFKGATVAAQNLSAVMGQDLQSSMVQIGKALNDPTEGISALSRVGVSFTAQQKEQIKTLQESGDIMGAQTVILKELEHEFGGAAEAAAGTFGGMFQQLKNAVGDGWEVVGKEIIDGLDLKGMLADAKSFMDGNGPKLMDGIHTAMEVLKPVVWAAWDVLKGLGGIVVDVVIPAFQAMAPVIKAIVEPLATVVGGIGNTIGAVSGVFRDALETTGLITPIKEVTAAQEEARKKAEEAEKAQLKHVEAVAASNAKTKEAADKLTKSLQEQVDTFGMTEGDKSVYKLQAEGVTDQATLDKVKALGDQLDILKEQKKVQDELAKQEQKSRDDLKKSAQKYYEDTLTADEKRRNEIADINRLEREGYVSAEVAQRARAKAEKDYMKSLLDEVKKDDEKRASFKINNQFKEKNDAIERRFTTGYTAPKADPLLEETKKSRKANEQAAKYLNDILKDSKANVTISIPG